MSSEPDNIIYSMVGGSKYFDKKPVLKYIYQPHRIKYRHLTRD